MVAGQPSALEQRRSDFQLTASDMPKLSIWVRLSNLPYEYWRTNMLVRIMVKAGVPMKVDEYTESVGKGGFTRDCILVNHERH